MKKPLHYYKTEWFEARTFLKEAQLMDNIPPTQVDIFNKIFPADAWQVIKNVVVFFYLYTFSRRKIIARHFVGEKTEQLFESRRKSWKLDGNFVWPLRLSPGWFFKAIRLIYISIL